MKYFVEEGSIVREIWGKGDTILFIFSGAAAEFACNKAVDWLFYTGKLPKDPLGRLFSTVGYARKIVFSEREDALKAIERINSIHAHVEGDRKARIPDWAYRDVLFMLIDYSIRSYEILERPLSSIEQQAVFDVFYRMGQLMEIKNLPKDLLCWQKMREDHLKEHLAYSQFTGKLFKQYREHLGYVRYVLLLESQRLILPRHVLKVLNLKPSSRLRPILYFYRSSRRTGADTFLRNLILPSEYLKEINELDVV